MDEFEAHRFLEKQGQPLTMVAMRQELKKIDIEKAEAALNEVLAEIAKIEKKKAKLSKKAAKGGVKGKAAQNEIEQIEASDPMPLRKAMVTAKAALRKAQKSDNVAAQGKMWFV